MLKSGGTEGRASRSLAARKQSNASPRPIDAANWHTELTSKAEAGAGLRSKHTGPMPGLTFEHFAQDHEGSVLLELHSLDVPAQARVAPETCRQCAHCLIGSQGELRTASFLAQSMPVSRLETQRCGKSGVASAHLTNPSRLPHLQASW